ncbi:hypothetical protein GGI05_001924 [Coemansia sp. RSA 2603]|nr:hypothetical protein GGI05_001924 [Coemansia sp. RSA 2603]
MKLIALLCTVFAATTCALPTGELSQSPPPVSGTPPTLPPTYKQCVAEHGGPIFKPPFPGECHEIGQCECQPDGSIACVC